MGDFNARVGVPFLYNDHGQYYGYINVKDEVVNTHGRMLLNICQNNTMVIANHLSHGGRQLAGDLSFRKR